MSSQPQLRQRKPKVIKAVEELDAFPKVPETCIDKTSYGGTASITAVVIIVWLTVLEFSYYFDPGYKFHFSPDTDLDTKLTINVDITVAMPCAIIGADIVDSTNQNVLKFGELEEEFTYFELSESQRSYFNAKANLNSYLREQYHSLQQILWKHDFINLYSEMPKLTSKERFARGAATACRLHGSLELNKVAGNFHITAGKTLPLPRGHAHIAAFMSDRDYNFSHRIYKFSFGDNTPAVISPLEGDEKIANSNHMLYQYFIQVVPTLVKTKFRTYLTYQYSVRELGREINHDKGSHGISGIFFKYDMSGLKVEVEEETYPWWMLLVRLCAVVGGVYATVGMIYNHLSLLGCSMRTFGRDRTKKEMYAPLSNQKSGHKKSGSISSNILTANSLVPPPNAVAPTLSFETPVVQLIGEPSETQPLCDLTKTEESNAINGLIDGHLPDLLASSRSSS
ncbi:unnamed protein product [Orchesella dallaii]|uniref:Endoplasmic reticulum-Golgi intermediate compartment protein 2 n=1 Tax=Orchesella dallaii TaxID=48710 RepID=A0ABP1QC88_9HEXA